MQTTIPRIKSSEYQEAVFDWIRNGRGHGIVNAVAGSGKTTTLVMASGLVGSNAVFCAFNKHIEKELTRRLPAGIACKTIHSLGLRAVSKALLNGSRNLSVNIDADKYHDLSSKYMEIYFPDIGYDKKIDTRNAMKKLVHLSQMTLTDSDDTEAMLDMAEFYQIDYDESIEDEEMLDAVRDILAEGKEMAVKSARIDFNDMIWLVDALDLSPATYDFILCDEAQDLSAAQLSLVRKSCSKDGRMLFIGDPAQSIYGFMGADPDSFYRIKEELKATELPLSICYRCASSIVEMAQEIVPQIQPAIDAIDGIAETIPEERYRQIISDGDMILCRTNAPLVRECLELIISGKKAKIIGRDIARQIEKHITEIGGMPDFDYGKFEDFLQEYSNEQIKRLVRRKNADSKISLFKDYIQAVKYIYNAFHVSSVFELTKKLHNIFSDENAPITLSTVHKAKGLENDRIFIIDPELMPLRFKNQSEWQAEQEMCIKYVAITRAKRELYFVGGCL